MIFCNLHGPIFEYFFVTEHQYTYELMYVFHTYNKLHETFSVKMIFGNGRPLPDDSTIVFLDSLSVSTNFIDTLLKALGTHFLWHCCVYQDKMKEISPPKKPTTLPE